MLKNKKFLLGIIILLILCILLTLGGIIYILIDRELDVKPDEGITTEIVDDSGWVGIDASIAVDKDNNPHISYFDQGNRDLKYAYKKDGKWNTETIDSTDDVGEESGISIDSEGTPHISYNDDSNGHLKYATKVNGKWEIEIVENSEGNSHVDSTSLKLDKNNHPHIAYNIEPGLHDDDTNEEKIENDINDNGISAYVKYASWDGQDWKLEIVTKYGNDVYLDIDSSNIPHISFRKEDPDSKDTSTKIAYAVKRDNEWEVQIADDDTDARGDTGIAIDSNGYPHIIYNDYENECKKYAYWDGTEWDTQTIASETGEGEGVKIAIGIDDKPRVVFNYSKGNKEHLSFATLNNDEWAIKKVDNMGNPAIVIDALGHAHLAYGHTAPNKQGFDTEGIEKLDEIEILKYAFIN